MTKTKTSTRGQARSRTRFVSVTVPLRDLGLAPENLRFAEPEDDDIGHLAETIHAAGVLYAPLVRKGRKGEQPYMVLKGRRRRYALLRLADQGRLADAAPVECRMAVDRASQVAAAILPNTELAPVHPADVIVAIGKLRATRQTTRQIADALGYHELEVKRLEAVSGVHADALEGFRRGRINLRQLRMFSRVKDMKRQAELADMALRGFFNEHLVHSAGVTGRVTESDSRFGLVKPEAYAQAGGRMVVDLFDELPPEVLDVELLDQLWRDRAAALCVELTDAGLDLSYGTSRGYAAPEGLEHLPTVAWSGLSPERRSAFEAASEALETAENALLTAEPEGYDAAFGQVLLAELADARLTAGRGEVVAGLVTPTDDGLTVTFFQRPAVEADPDAEADDDEDEHAEDGDALDDDEDAPAIPPVNGVVVPLTGVTNQQHAARTEIMTEGLIRDLADKPEAAIVVLTAHLFRELVLAPYHGRDQSVLQITAHPGVRGHGPGDGLAGEVWGWLAAKAEAFEASGQRPIAYVTGLEPADRLDLLAALVAVTVDLREARTDQVRKAARAEAVEVAALCDANLARRWTPDTAFLTLHAIGQMEVWLAEMGAERPDDARLKADVVQVTQQAAAERRWIPDCLRWPAPEVDPDALPDGAVEPVGEAADEPVVEPVTPVETDAPADLPAAA